MNIQKIGLACLVTILLANASAASESAGWVQATVSDPKNSAQYHEIQVTGFNQDADFEATLDQFRKDLDQAIQKNPSLVVSVHEVESQPNRSPQSKDSRFFSIFRNRGQKSEIIETHTLLTEQDLRPSVSAKVKKWFRSNYRGSFTLIRGFANGGIQTWSLIKMDQPPEIAVAAGLVVGALCAGLTWYLPKISDFTDHAKVTQNFLAKFRTKLPLVFNGATFSERMFRWFLAEFAFVHLIKSAYLLLAIDPLVGFISMEEEIASAAFWSTLSQGLYEVGIYRERSRLLEQKVDTTDVEIRVQVFALVGSVLSVAGAIGKIQGLETAPYLLGGLAGLGVINWIRIDQKAILDSWNKLRHNCNRWFRTSSLFLLNRPRERRIS